jgi:hypothetical protein
LTSTVNRTGWLTSTQSRSLLWTALVLSLVLGVALVVVDRHEADPVGQFGAPLTDEQAIEQVVGSARRIVAAAHLQDAAGGYSFVSCATQNGPPYQVALYMNFTLPQSDWIRYLDEVASAMVVDGWADAPAKAEHFGRKLTKGGVTAVLQRNVDDPTSATMRLYGECRNTGDHRHDNPAWTEDTL